MRTDFLRIGWLLLGSIAVTPSLAMATTSDFVCIPASHSHATYFNSQVRNCGGAQADVKQGICQEDAQCAYIPAATQLGILDAYNRTASTPAATFQTIPTAQKMALLKSGFGMTLSYHSSVVTCPGKIVAGNGGGPMCPSPDKCKGDAMVDADPRNAQIDFSDMNTMLNAPPTMPASEGAPGSAGGAQVPVIDREFR
jgi:hypothetical protein